MTEQNPPIFLQAGSHPAEDVRRMLTSQGGWDSHGGLAASTHLSVSEAGTPDMTVDVGAGGIWIPGDEATYQGMYFCESRGTVNLAISASDATNARKDLVVAKVEDSAYSGATDAWSLAVVTGTPAGSPSEPTAPANSIVLAMIDVPALDTAITDSQITERQMTNTKGTYPKGIRTCLSTARPSTKQVGTQIYETDTLRSRTWDGTYWLETDGPVYVWTPVIRSGLTIGNGSMVGRYWLQGWVLHWQLDIRLGSTSVMGTDPKIYTPGTMTIDGSAGGRYQVGSAMARDNGTLWYQGLVMAFDSGDDTLTTRVLFNTTTISSTAPFTWTTDDRLVCEGSFAMSDVDAPTS